MKIDKNTRFLIVGLGLLGGSYAMALKKQGFRVEAVTRSRDSIDYALEQGIIDAGAASPDPELIGRADVVVLALYPHVLLDWVRENQRYFRPGALITDVTGVKTAVVGPVQAMLRQEGGNKKAHCGCSALFCCSISSCCRRGTATSARYRPHTAWQNPQRRGRFSDAGIQAGRRSSPAGTQGYRPAYEAVLSGGRAGL